MSALAPQERRKTKRLATCRDFQVTIWLHLGCGRGLNKAYMQDQGYPPCLFGGGWAPVRLEQSQATTWLRVLLRHLESVMETLDAWLGTTQTQGPRWPWSTAEMHKLLCFWQSMLSLQQSTMAFFDPDVPRSKRWPRKGCNSLRAIMRWLSEVNAEELWYQNQNLQSESHDNPE